MLTYTLLGPPRTKKNHQRILRGAGGKPTSPPRWTMTQPSRFNISISTGNRAFLLV